MTPYEVLGVPPTATTAEVTAAYRVLAQIFHPDRFAEMPEPVRAEAERRMREINEAYHMLRRGESNGSIRRTTRVSPTGWSRFAQAPPMSKRQAEQARMAATPWDVAARQRAEQSRRAEQARRVREQQAPSGKARVEPKSSRFGSTLTGLGEALHTSNVKCRGCASVQWLPDGWRELLDDYAFFCSRCGRLLLAR